MVVGLGGIQIQGLCEIRSAADPGILCDLYDSVTDPVSVLSVRRETFELLFTL